MYFKNLFLAILSMLCVFELAAQHQKSIQSKTASIPGDENWDWRFDKPGVSNIVLSAYADSNDLYIGGNFTKAGTVDAANIARYDGKRWYAMGSGIGGAQDGIYAIKKYGSYIYAAGSTGVHRWDGASWTTIGTLSGPVTNALAVNDIDIDANGNVYALGQFVQINGVTANCIAKWNGTAWSALGSGIGPFINGVYTGSVRCMGNNVYISGYFSTVGGVAANSVAKWNGTSWSALGNGTNGLTFLGVQGNNLIATGTFTTAGAVTASHVALWNGTAWSAMGAGFNYEGYDVCVYNNEIYVAGLFDHSGVTPVNYIAKWNGTAWIDAGNGFNIYTGQGLAKSSKYFIAYGGTGVVNNIDMGSIAQWNGTKWITIGNGINGTVYAMATWNNKIIAGGNFTQAGGITANRFAMWDGNKWDTLLNEFTFGTIYAIAIMNNEIYVGGNFILNNNLTSNYVAKWNGSHWVAVGGDVDYTVYTLEVDGSNLYAGGEFIMAGGAGANHIAKWDGSNWSALGIGTNNTVKSIKADGLGNLYVGGVFTTAGSTTVNRIAKWNGSAWSAMASGVNNIVNAVGISPAGEVYLGGIFDIGVNGNLLYRFAKFNGTSWVAVGGSFPTISNNVANIHFACGQLYVCGSLTTASGNTVNCIAHWDGTNWSNLGNGLLFNNSIPQTYVNAMTSLGDDLYAGGIFNLAGDKPSQNIAHYKIEGFPEVNITTATNNICKGDTIIFTANAINAGAVPTYQWFVNGINAASGSSFTTSILNDNDMVYCNVTTNPVCAVPAIVSSNTITIHADSLTIPIISLAGNTLTVTNPDANATYIWQEQQSGIWNDIFPQVTGVSYTYTNPGIYRARAEKGACEKFSNAVITTSINENNLPIKFVLYPNPSKKELNVEWSATKINFDRIEIINTVGQQVDAFIEKNPGVSFKINTSDLKSGMYYIRLTANDDSICMLKFVKD